MPDFLQQVEDNLEMAIEERRYEDAKALRDLRDWLAYDKRTGWIPSLELLETL